MHDILDDQFSSQYVRWISLVSIAGIALVFITRFVRPFLADAHPLIVFVFGILPNFGAGLALPFAGVMWVRGVWRIKRWSLSQLFAGIAVLSFAGLLIWEVVQLVAWAYPFDANDIVATAVGVLCTIVVHLLLVNARPPAPQAMRPQNSGEIHADRDQE